MITRSSLKKHLIISMNYVTSSVKTHGMQMVLELKYLNRKNKRRVHITRL